MDASNKHTSAVMFALSTNDFRTILAGSTWDSATRTSSNGDSDRERLPNTSYGRATGRLECRRLDKDH